MGRRFTISQSRSHVSSEIRRTGERILSGTTWEILSQGLWCEVPKGGAQKRIFPKPGHQRMGLNDGRMLFLLEDGCLYLSNVLPMIPAGRPIGEIIIDDRHGKFQENNGCGVGVLTGCGVGCSLRFSSNNRFILTTTVTVSGSSVLTKTLKPEVMERKRATVIGAAKKTGQVNRTKKKGGGGGWAWGGGGGGGGGGSDPLAVR